MSLHIIISNISNLAPVSNYQADVFINSRKIAGPLSIKGHKRSDGWQKLVKTFAKQLKTKPYKSLAQTHGSFNLEELVRAELEKQSKKLERW